VLSAIIGAAGIGLLLGLSLRVPALLVASAAVVVSGLGFAVFSDVPGLTVALTTMGSLVALQASYVGGVAAWIAWPRLHGSISTPRQTDPGIPRWTEAERPSSPAR
jgi:hypothetical protein